MQYWNMQIRPVAIVVIISSFWSLFFCKFQKFYKNNHFFPFCYKNWQHYCATSCYFLSLIKISWVQHCDFRLKFHTILSIHITLIGILLIPTLYLISIRKNMSLKIVKSLFCEAVTITISGCSSHYPIVGICLKTWSLSYYLTLSIFQEFTFNNVFSIFRGIAICRPVVPQPHSSEDSFDFPIAFRRGMNRFRWNE